MSGVKFAPGPWSASANSWQHTTVYDVNQMPVCRLDLDDWGVDEGNQAELEKAQTAIARMIAAAPELLEALRKLELGANTVDYCYTRNPGAACTAATERLRRSLNRSVAQHRMHLRRLVEVMLKGRTQ